MIIPLMAAELYGLAILGRVMGVVLTADGVAEALVPMGVAALRDHYGPYGPGFGLLIGAGRRRRGGRRRAAPLRLPTPRPAQPAATAYGSQPRHAAPARGRSASPRRARLRASAASLALRGAAAGAAARRAGPSAPPVRRRHQRRRAVAEAVVSVALPAGLVGESFVLREEDDGDAVVAQILRDRTLVFAVRDLAPREVRRLRLEPALDRRVAGPVVARERFDGVDLSIDGRPVATYRTQPAVSLADDGAAGAGRGGYLHPLRTPAGRIVTDDDVPAQPEQRGLWSAWGATRVDGRTADFWHTSRGTGAVEFEGVLEAWSGPVVAGFRARHRAVDRTVRPPLTAETETWQVTVPALGGPRPERRAGPARAIASST